MSQSTTDTTDAFTATITKAPLEDFLDPIATLVDECRFRLTDAGLTVRAVDPANVGMVDTNLAPKGMESYEASTDLIGLNLARFQDIIGMADADSLIHITLDKATRKLTIEFDGLEYTMALIDPDSIRQDPDIPDLDLNAELVMEGQNIHRIVKGAEMVSDHIALTVNPTAETFTATAEGDTDDISLDYDADDLIEYNASGNAHSLFSLDYLADMKKAIPKDAELTIELGEDFPVYLNYSTADGVVDTTFLLAPRIQSE